MNILLTGSSGFLGKEIINQNNSHIIFSLNRKIGNYKFDLSTTIPDFGYDLFDIVIHTAGKAHLVPKNRIENETFFDVNVKGTQNLLYGIEISGALPKCFIFISSVAVYGVDQGMNISENEPLLAKDPYGLSKIQAEKLVFNWCQKNNVICTILRLPLLVGDNPPGNLGALISSIRKGYYFNIAGGKARKSMVLTEDVANILFKVSKIGGIYNLTDGSHPNFYELSNVLAKQYGKTRIFNMPFFIAKCIAFLGDVFGTKFPLNSRKLKKITSDLTFDDSKAMKVLNWKPKQILNWYDNKSIEL